jgi:dipeptidyl aminopeptidase/acylaminoacyl peptidase
MRKATSLALLVLAGVAVAEPPPRDHDIVLEDYFDLAFITSCAMAPDGSRIAYTEMRWEPERDARNTDLWVVDADTGAPTRLTFDPAADTAPAWSPDGRWIYFASARTDGDGEDPPANGKTQVWRVGAAGGAITPVTRAAKGVQQFELSRDGRTLWYTVGADRVDEDRWKPLRERYEDLEYGHGEVTGSQLRKLDLVTWRSEQVVDDGRVIGAFTVTPDGRRVAMVTTPTEELITNEGWSRIDIHDVERGTTTTVPDRLWREEAPSPYGWIVSPTWSDDGRALALRVDFDGYPGEMFVAEIDDEGAATAFHVPRPNEVSVEGGLAWWPGTRDLCFVADDHARARLWCIREVRAGGHGGAFEVTPGDVVVEEFSFARAGDRVAYLRGDARSMPDLHVQALGDDAGPPRRVTSVNPQVDTWKLPQISVVQWTAEDGTTVEGILELPPDHDPAAGPLPLVVEIHGGPTSSTKHALRFWIYGRTLFAARGWALLSPNYRGSTGYGDAFLTDLIGHKNDRDVSDIIAGVDALIERGIADPDRLAVMGWSNGGYLTNCLVTRDQRFRAASSGAGVLDTVMQWSIEDTPGHVINYSQGFPWTNAAVMHRTSPLYQVDRIRTPTLIHVGEHDARVPPEHSRALHRALHHYLDVPCELLVYPDAGHGLTKHSHRKAKLEWDVAWFDYHVLGREPE